MIRQLHALIIECASKWNDFVSEHSEDVSR
jgi:hypothetical protein